MKPKEKAECLCKEFFDYVGGPFHSKEEYDKQNIITINCAIIASNQLLLPYAKFPKHPLFKYYSKVKKHLEKKLSEII